MDLRPLRDRVVVKRTKSTEILASGIIIPDSAKEKALQTEAVAVGTGKLLPNGLTASLEVKPGDRNLLGKYTGSGIKIDGQEHLAMREDEILAVLD